MAGRSLVRTAQPRLRRSWPGLAAGTLGALSAVALLASSAFLVTRAAEQPPILFLSLAIVGVRAFALFRAVFRYVERLASHDAAFRQLAVVRTELYRRLARVAPAGLGRTDRGDLLGRVVADVDALQDLPLRVVQPLVVSGTTAVVSVAVVALVSPSAALVLAVCLVVAAVVGSVLADRLASASEHRSAAARGRLAAAVLDLVQGFDVLVAFEAVDRQLDLVERVDREVRRESLRRATTSGLVTGLLSLLSGLAVLGSVAAAAPAVAAGDLSGPAFALVALVPLAVFEVVGAVPVAVLARRRVLAAGARVDAAVPAEVPEGVVDQALDDVDADEAAGGTGRVRLVAGLDRDTGAGGGRPAGPVAAGTPAGSDVPEPGADPGSTRAGARGPARASGPALVVPPVGSPVLELEGLSARWPGAGGDALRDVDLVVRTGDRIVVEGPSGAGKSTLAAVLARFLERRGRYAVAGVEVGDVPAARVREVVGLLEQDPWTFDADVRQNLLFARDTATDSELEEVLGRVGLGPWLAERGGLRTRLGERGALVSGGQAHRLSLARALLRGFPVLVLDEPTAGVDPELADRLVDDVLRTARDAGTTVLLATHVPVADELVTRRLRVEDGTVRELPRTSA